MKLTQMTSEQEATIARIELREDVQSVKRSLFGRFIVNTPDDLAVIEKDGSVVWQSLKSAA
jgi:hypothetical protein